MILINKNVSSKRSCGLEVQSCFFGLTKLPKPSISASVPALAKLNAIKYANSKVVATELLKETGLEDELAVAALADALPPSILLSFLDGSRLHVANLLTCFNAYK